MRASHSFVLDISWQRVHKHMLLTDGGRHNWDFYHNISPMLPSCTREAKMYGLVRSITAGQKHLLQTPKGSRFTLQDVVFRQKYRFHFSFHIRLFQISGCCKRDCFLQSWGDLVSWGTHLCGRAEAHGIGREPWTLHYRQLCLIAQMKRYPLLNPIVMCWASKKKKIKKQG